MKSSKLSFIIIIVLAVAIGLFSYSFLSGAKTTTYVFNSDYSAGQEISFDMLTPTEIDNSVVMRAAETGGAGYITKDNVEEFVGSYLRTNVYAGTPFMSVYSDDVGGSGAEKALADGMVAVTVPATNITAGSPEISADSKVNIYSNYQKDRESTTELILQNIRVVDVLYSEVYNDVSEAPVVEGVTLEVSPEDSAKVQHAAEFGTVRLSIVNPQYAPSSEVVEFTLSTAPDQGEDEE